MGTRERGEECSLLRSLTSNFYGENWTGPKKKKDLDSDNLLGFFFLTCYYVNKTNLYRSHCKFQETAITISRES